MARIEKKIQRLRESPKDVSSRELINILVYLGFEEKGGKGSHTVLRHPSLRSIITIPHQNPLMPVYVRKAVRMIDEILEEDKDD